MPTATELLDAAIQANPSNHLSSLSTWRERARTALRVALGPGDEMIARFDSISYSLGMWSSNTPQTEFDRAKRRGITDAIAMLESAKVILDASQPATGTITALPGSLHPWVAGVAATAWANGLHRPAVEEAARNIDVQLQIKLGGSSKTGAPLITDAFATKPPVPGDPRLRFQEFTSGTPNWTNAHEGAQAFGRGCMMRIRNLYTHGHEPSVDEAYEAVVALSLLARWIDAAVVETAT